MYESPASAVLAAHFAEEVGRNLLLELCLKSQLLRLLAKQPLPLAKRRSASAQDTCTISTLQATNKVLNRKSSALITFCAWADTIATRLCLGCPDMNGAL